MDDEKLKIDNTIGITSSEYEELVRSTVSRSNAFEEASLSKERRRRVIFLLTATIGLFFVSLLFISVLVNSGLLPEHSFFVVLHDTNALDSLVMASAIIFVLLTALVVTYERFPQKPRSETEALVRREGNEALRKIKEQTDERLRQFTDEKIAGLVKDQVTKEALGELLVNTPRAVWDQYLDDRIEQEINAIRDNLTDWLREMRTASTLNLFIALGFAIAGMYAAYSLLSPNVAEFPLRFSTAPAADGAAPDADLVRDLLFVLLPRTLLVIALEVIAFHFFRMHQSALASAQYVRDEINSIRFKTTAFYTALRVGTKEFQKEVIGDFLHQERHKTLANGESTLGLEREKLAQDSLHILFKEFLRQYGTGPEVTRSAMDRKSGQDT